MLAQTTSRCKWLLACGSVAIITFCVWFTLVGPRGRASFGDFSVFSQKKNGSVQAELAGGGFELSKKESLGFFAEDDRTWELRKQIMSLHRRKEQAAYSGRSGFGCHGNTERWRGNQGAFSFFEPFFNCAYEMRLGSPGDGGKWVCDPHKLRERVGSMEKHSPCLIYSVGSHGDFSFEEDVTKSISSSCEVHTFDQHNYTAYTGKKKPEFINYHIVTIGNSPGTKNLTTIVTDLGHANRVIDIFKIDCEGCEYVTYKSWFGNNVFIRQVLIEIHTSTDTRIHDIISFMYGMGYALFHKENTEYSFLKLDQHFYSSATAAPEDVTAASDAVTAAASGSELPQAAEHDFILEASEDWRRRKVTHALQKMRGAKEPSFNCIFARRIGRAGDGGKWVCDPHRIGRQPTCLVYSIVSDDVLCDSFEQSVRDEIGARCEVHVIISGRGKSDEVPAPSGHVHYHRYDAGNTTPAQHLSAIMQDLGHGGREIDILKVDCGPVCPLVSGTVGYFRNWLGGTVLPRQVLVRVLDDHCRNTACDDHFWDEMFRSGYVIAHKAVVLGPLGGYHLPQEFSFLRLGDGFCSSHRGCREQLETLRQHGNGSQGR